MFKPLAQALQRLSVHSNNMTIHFYKEPEAAASGRPQAINSVSDTKKHDQQACAYCHVPTKGLSQMLKTCVRCKAAWCCGALESWP